MRSWSLFLEIVATYMSSQLSFYRFKYCVIISANAFMIKDIFQQEPDGNQKKFQLLRIRLPTTNHIHAQVLISRFVCDPFFIINTDKKRVEL